MNPGYPCCCGSTVPASSNQCTHCPSSEAPDGYVFAIDGVGSAASTYCSTDYCSDINASFAVDAAALASPPYCSGSRNVDVCCQWTQNIDWVKYFHLLWNISSGSTHAWKINATVNQTIYRASSECSTLFGFAGYGGVEVRFESTEFASTTKCHHLNNYSMTKVNTTGLYVGSSEACDFSSITLNLSAY